MHLEMPEIAVIIVLNPTANKYPDPKQLPPISPNDLFI